MGSFFRVTICLLLALVVPRIAVGVLSEMSDTDLKGVRGTQGINFNQVFKKKEPVAVVSAQSPGIERNVSFDQAFAKPKPVADNQTISFDEAFSNVTDAMAGGDMGAAAAAMKTIAVGAGNVKTVHNLNVEMNMSLDEVFTAVTGVDAGLDKLGFQGNVNTQIQGDVSVQFRP